MTVGDGKSKFTRAGRKHTAQREADYDARVLISAELGHGREVITAAYLGR